MSDVSIPQVCFFIIVLKRLLHKIQEKYMRVFYSNNMPNINGTL